MSSKNNFTLLLLFLFLTSCIITSPIDKENGCHPPKTFIRTDIIGIWESGLPERKDTLIINEDVTYKQIIHIENISYDYESELKNWWIEESSDGIPYLHLDGMRLCVYWSGIDCELIGGNEYEWYDFCQEKWLQMPDSGIFVILGTPDGFENSTYKLGLFALQKSTEDVIVYEYKTMEP